MKIAPHQIDPIAIIGMGCRFPGNASNPRKFWNLLCEGKNTIREVPRDRWDSRRFYHPNMQAPGKMYVSKGGFLEEKWEHFDAEFFHISPREAPFLDPQQRLLLELTWEAMEDAGIILEKMNNSDTGVFIGAFTTDWQSLHSHPSNITHCGVYSGINSSLTILSARLSYFFNLKGPCLTVDTACSSSLVAVHLACQNLWQNACSLAFAGGVNAMIIPQTTIAMSKGRFLNPDGHCCAFADNAKGYIRGEGGGVVLLKRLSDAIRDQDPIYALIRGTGVNHDGATQGIAQPNPVAQKTLIQKVLTESRIKPEQILFVEAHGTGTPIGDPLEAQALNEVLNVSKRSQPCYVGAVKTNLGHLEAAAGIAGLIKTALCLKQKKIPPNLHFETANPNIPFDKYCLKIPTQLEDFPSSESPLFACVNAFGYGGTNAHAVLQSYESSNAFIQSDVSEYPLLLPFTAKTPDALKEVLKTHEQFLENNPQANLTDIAYTLSQKRSFFQHRLTISAKSIPDLKTKLNRISKGINPDGCIQGKTSDTRPKLVFVYTGMGPQWQGMGKQLMESSPLFSETLQNCDQIIFPMTGWSLLDELRKTEDLSRMDDPVIAQLANIAIQIALTELLKKWDIVPQAIVGHSVGEVAAAYAAGVLSLKESLLVTYHRSTIQAKQKNQGTMLAIGLGSDETKPLIEKYSGVSIAAENSPHSITLAGNQVDLASIAELLEKMDVFNRFLKVNIAYHSYQMDGLENEVLSALNSLSPKKPLIPLFSTVYGNECHQEPLDAHYWWLNIRQPVLFGKATQNIINKGHHSFLEIGPHPVLASFIRENLNHLQIKGEVFCSLNRKKTDMNSLQECLGNLFVSGFPLSWSKIQPGHGQLISLPAYPWQKKPHWIEAEESHHFRLSANKHVMLSRKIPSPNPTWQVEVNRHYFSWLEDHKIAGTIIFPAAAYVEAALALQDEVPCVLENIHFQKLLTIHSSKETILQSSLDQETRSFKIHSQLETDTWEFHASGTCSPYKIDRLPEKIKLDEWLQTDPFDAQLVYDQFAKKGLEYGPSFQGIKKLWRGRGEALSEIQVQIPEEIVFLYPPILDSAFQTLIGTITSSIEDGMILPIQIDQMIVYNYPKGHVFCYAKCTKETPDKVVGDLSICNESGEICVEIKGLQCRLFLNPSTQSLDQFLYSPIWEEKPLPENTPLKDNQTWLIEHECSRSLVHFLKDKDLSTYYLSQLSSLEECEQLLIQSENVKDLNILIGYKHSDDSLASSEVKIVQACVNLVKAIEKKRNPQHNTTLWIVTQGTQPVVDDTHIQMAGASLWGLFRVIRQEFSQLRIKCIDLDSQPDWSVIALESVNQQPEDEIAWRNGKRYCYALKRRTQSQIEINTSLSSPRDAFSLELKKSGSIENLFFQQTEKKLPKAGEVGIQVHASSLNFKDLMKVLGMLDQNVLDETYFGKSFGMECSGTIVSVGPKVKFHQIGDKVCAFIPNTFQSHLNVPIQCIYPTPPHTSFEEAPIYIPFLTVLRALKDIAKLKKGECILIHSATGAVGLAAIQYAKYIGAKIIATAGNEEKRQYLRHLGILCSDSRSLSFVEDVMQWTQGRGVDVILNSLGGDALTKSWALLAPYGRFVEIGKRDISLNSSLPMQPFNKNTTFSAIDLDRTFIDQPALIKRLLKETHLLFSQQIFQPLPCKIFPASDVVDAFQFMARSKHIGKIMLKFDEQTVQGIPLSSKKAMLNPKCSYLVTGGFSGFGLTIAQWLAKKGAKSLILIGRSGPSSSEAKEVLDQLKKDKIHVKAASVDITDSHQLAKLLTECAQDMPPLKGIIHSAMVLNDSLVTQLSHESIQQVLLPKIAGCLNLHHLTSHLPLDFFILFSSISSIIGNPGQGNYSAANSFLDSFCHYRRKLGLPALTINWGALNTGILARNSKVAKHLENHGINAMSTKLACQILEKAFLENDVQLCAFDLNWQKLMEAMPPLRKSSTFMDFSHRSANTSTNTFVEELRTMDELQRLDYITHAIKETIAKTLRMDPSSLDISTRINTLGIDSLMAMELQTTMEDKLDAKIPTIELMKGPSIKQLAQLTLELYHFS